MTDANQLGEGVTPQGPLAALQQDVRQQQIIAARNQVGEGVTKPESSDATGPDLEKGIETEDVVGKQLEKEVNQPASARRKWMKGFVLACNIIEWLVLHIATAWYKTDTLILILGNYWLFELGGILYIVLERTRDRLPEQGPGFLLLELEASLLTMFGSTQMLTLVLELLVKYNMCLVQYIGLIKISDLFSKH